MPRSRDGRTIVGVNVFKSVAERRVEALTWGALLVWVGISLIVDLNRGLGPTVEAGRT